MRTEIFWALTQRVMVIHIGQISLGFLALEGGTDRFTRNVGKELPDKRTSQPLRHVAVKVRQTSVTRVM